MSRLPGLISVSLAYTLLCLPLSLFSQSVGINTSSPTAGLHVAHNDGFLVTGEFGQGNDPISGYGSRLLWRSSTSSFRFGRITDESGGIYETWWNHANTGDYSFAGGVNTLASGFAAFSMGYQNKATGTRGFAGGGQGNHASGTNSFAAGLNNTAFAANEFVAGMYATEYTPGNQTGYLATDRIFVVGNGTDIANRSNAMTILKSGNVGIGTDTPESLLHLKGVQWIDEGRIEFINTGGSVFIGEEAGLFDDHSFNDNVFIGKEAGKYVVTGGNNIALGRFALTNNISGARNISIGVSSLMNNTASLNIAIGFRALSNNTTGASNIATGDHAMYFNLTGSENVVLGEQALYLTTTGSRNVVLGYHAGIGNTGDENTLIGHEAGLNNTGSGNVFIGRRAGYDETGSDRLYIENSESDTPLIYGDFTQNTVIINDSLQSKYFRMTHNPGSGRLLQSDVSGNATWVEPSSVFSDDWSGSGMHIYNANAGNVGIGTSSPQSKLHLAGDLLIDGGRITVDNTGGSVIIGQNTGVNDALDDNSNVFIGQNTGYATTEGSNNIALGENALTNNITGNRNIAMGLYSQHSNEASSGNISIGEFSLYNTTTGGVNTAIGAHALENNTIGEFNIAMGFFAGQSIAGDENTIIGHEAGVNTAGSGNVLLGFRAGHNEAGSNKLYIDNSDTATPLIHGDFSTNHLTINDSLTSDILRIDGGRLNFINTGQSVFIGFNAGRNDDHSDNNNVFVGHHAGKSNTTGTNNIAIGAHALDDAPSANYSIAIGEGVLGNANITGGYNTGIGNFSLASIISGSDNLAMGQNAGGQLTHGIRNIALGNYALDAMTGGTANTVVGYEALGNNVDGNNNTVMGHYAGSGIQGSNNVIVGTEAGLSATGSGNVFLGMGAGANEAGDNKLYIENSTSASPLIHGDFAANEITINDSLTVNKELGVATSTPRSTMEVNGSVGAAFKSGLTAGTVQPDDTGMVWRYNSGTGDIVLPAASSCTNRIYVIINQTGATRNISQYRDLVTNFQTTISSSVALWLMSDGTNWWQIK